MPLRLPSLSPEARRVVILANPRAGASSARAAVDDLVDTLRRKQFKPTVCWQREDFSHLIQSIEPENLRCVVAAGGDGTLVEALNRAPGRPMALLPLGTENLMARYWKIDRSAGQVAQVIAGGRVRTLDLGRLYSSDGNLLQPSDSGLRSYQSIHGRMFCLMSSFGFDAEVVHRLHARRRGHINLFSYAWPLFDTIRRYKFPVMEVEIVETGEKLKGTMIFIFNLPRYGGGIPIAPEARGDDGHLDMVVFERGGKFHVLRYLTSVLRGLRNRLRDVHHRLVKTVRLTALQPIRAQTDGDPAGALPATVEVVPAALKLVVP